MEIIGSGYAHEVAVGQSYIRESVVSMWDRIAEVDFKYHHNGITFILERITNKGDGRIYRTVLRKEDITPEIITALKEKGISL